MKGGKKMRFSAGKSHFLPPVISDTLPLMFNTTSIQHRYTIDRLGCVGVDNVVSHVDVIIANIIINKNIFIKIFL